MVKAILGGRASGKTTELVMMAAKENVTIITMYPQPVRDAAAKMGVHVQIASMHTFLNGGLRWQERSKRYYIDELESVLSYVGGVKIEGYTSGAQPTLLNKRKTLLKKLIKSVKELFG